MIKRALVKGRDQVKVTFVLPVENGNPAAAKVAVAGEFNGWDPQATVLRKRGESRSASVTLDAGQRYAFRYVDTAEDRWFNDEAADSYERNEFGGENSIVDLTV